MPLAPPELKEVHPLGKSPVITDGGKTIAESGAIVEYMLDTYGNGRMKPTPGTDDYWKYVEWMHYAEGSAMLPLLLALYSGMLGDGAAPLQPRIDSEIANHLSLHRERARRPRVLRRQRPDGRRHPDRSSSSKRPAPALEPYPRLGRVPRPHARAAGVQARAREGRAVPADVALISGGSARRQSRRRSPHGARPTARRR